MNPFELLVYNLNQMGFFGFLLPWLLMFAVTYGLLMKSKALGEDQKIIGVVSLVAAFFVVGYGGPLLGTFFSNLFGIAAVVLGGILVTVLFISMAGGDISKFAESKEIMALLAGVGIIVFMIVLGTFGVGIESDVVAAIFMVIVMAVAVVFIAGKQ
jgi:hypothetical protein